MSIFQLSDLLYLQGKAGKPYLEFLCSQSLSVGVYVLPVGAVDHQSAHGEDEVYYAARGRGMLYLDDKEGGHDQRVEPGSVIFVGAGVEHRFHDISEDLVLVVFFAPPEGSRAKEKVRPAG